MTKLPISVCIIAKNEQKYIENCLKALRRYSWEIIVVDTGSTDDTRQIATRYADKVYDFTWIDDFSAARNFAAAQASNNWILVLDCDEYLTQLDEKALRICMQQHLRHVGMMGLTNVYTQPDGEHTYKAEEVPRFYNRNFFEYRFRIHEQITPKNQVNLEEVCLSTYRLPVEVEHHGYDITPEEMERKQARNLTMLQSALGETPFDDYLYFQMGQSYYILKRYDDAAKAYAECFARNDNPEKGFMKVAVPAYARLLLELDKGQEAREHLMKYADRFKGAEYGYLLGCAHQACGDNLLALLTFVKVTQMSDIDALGEQAYDTFVRIMLLHNLAGNTEGVEHFRQRLEEYGRAHGRPIVFE